MGSRVDFFISYSHPDEDWASWLSHTLEAEGYRVISQVLDFGPGANFVLEMHSALQRADRLMMVLSPDYLTSRFSASEWAAAFAQDPVGEGRRLIPVMVRECDPPGLLTAIIQIRLHDAPDAAQARHLLLSGLRPGRRVPATPPEFPGARRGGSAPAS